MNGQIVKQRMSPLTAFFIGLFVLGTSIVAGASTILMYGLRIVDRQADHVVRLVDDLADDIPSLLNSLPDTLDSMFNDRRALGYAQNVATKVHLVVDGPGGRAFPSVTIENRGDEVITFLSVNVAALNEQGVPVAAWSEVIATPYALGDDWPGPIAPGASRHAILASWRGKVAGTPSTAWSPVVEITDVRVLQRGSSPQPATVQTASGA